MNRLTPLVLLVVVGVLAYVAYLQTEREVANPIETTTPLFPGVEVRRVSAVRLENVASSRHMRFQRDAGGRWYMTDPMAWPAELGLMEKIEQIVRSNQATEVPAALLADAEASFDPPRAFVETEEQLENGETRRVRVELGATDIDGMRVYVRRDGTIYRTLRNIETLFTLTVNDFRARNVFSMSPGEIVMIERTGGWYEGTVQEILGMRAYREGYGWRIEKPARAAGDPVLFSLWTRFLGSLQSQRFASDRPDDDLSRFGLDQPWLTITLTSGSGATQSVHFAAKEGRAFCRRDEQTTIYEIQAEDAIRVREPVTNFFDGAYVRFERTQLRSVRLGRGEGSVRLTQSGDRWTVAERTAGGADYDMDLPADQRAVEDLLTAIEGAGVLRYFTDAPPSDFFPDGRGDRGIWVETIDGAVQGGAFAGLSVTLEGTEFAPFVRDGDDIVGALAPDVAALADASITDYLDRQLWTLSNARLRGLTIERDGRARSFQRADEYDWRPVDADVPARELDPVLDHLIFFKAESHIGQGDRPELTDVVTVTFVEGDGKRHVARIGATADGEVQADVGPMRAVLKRQELHGDLLEIVAKKPDRSPGG